MISYFEAIGLFEFLDYMGMGYFSEILKSPDAGKIVLTYAIYEVCIYFNINFYLYRLYYI